MKNLKQKFSKMEDESGKDKPEGIATSGRGRGRGRGGRGRGRGKVAENSGSDLEEGESSWSLRKYDFEAPDVKESVKDHKPNFVKAPRRVFEKHDGYYSEDE